MGDQVRYDCEVTIDKFYKNIYHIYMGALMVYVDTLLIDLGRGNSTSSWIDKESTFSVSGLSEVEVEVER